jgi:hypothetical protein
VAGVALVVLEPPRGGRAHREEMQVLASRGREVDEGRRVVEDVDPPSVRAQDEIALPRVDEEVVDGDGRQVLAPDRRPACPSIPAHPEGPLGPDEEDIGVLRVLADDADGAARGQVAGDCFPGLAMVGGEEEVDGEAVRAVAVEADVGHASPVRLARPG